MSQRSKLRQSREQWKCKAHERAETNRYLRKQLVRVRAERERWREQAKQVEARLRPLETPPACRVVQEKADLVWLALRLFLIARIGFRAVSRVLNTLSEALGIVRAPCPQTIINWVMRLSLVRIQSAPPWTGARSSADRFSKGVLWLIDASIGLGTGKILAVLAIDAAHHQHHQAAPRLHQVHCVAVSVAASWTGETIADFLQQVIAVRGRPSAYLKDGGTDLHKAVSILSQRGLPSLCIADISHAVANLLKRHYRDHPALATFLAACGTVSGKLKQTLLACLAPPKVHTKARFMNLHRLVRWAEQLLQLSPPGGTARGSVLAKLRTCLDRLPACKAFIHRFRDEVRPLLACQQILKSRGLNHATILSCEPLLDTIPSAAVRSEFGGYLNAQLETATQLGLAEVGLPISSDPIESLFGLAKQHGSGEIKDAQRIAMRLPALCGTPTRTEAQQVLEISVAQQQQMTSQLTSLTKQRREVLPNPQALETLALPQSNNAVVLIPRSKNRPNCSEVIPLSKGYKKAQGPQPNRQQTDSQPARAGP